MAARTRWSFNGSYGVVVAWELGRPCQFRTGREGLNRPVLYTLRLDPLVRREYGLERNCSL